MLEPIKICQGARASAAMVLKVEGDSVFAGCSTSYGPHPSILTGDLQKAVESSGKDVNKISSVFTFCRLVHSLLGGGIMPRFNPNPEKDKIEANHPHSAL